MIKMNISSNEIENSFELKELYSYLKQRGYEIDVRKKYIEDAKADLVTLLTLGFTAWAAIYPMIQDLQAWSRPKKYSISLTQGSIVASANDLTEEEFLILTERFNIKQTNIEFSKK